MEMCRSPTQLPAKPTMWFRFLASLTAENFSSRNYFVKRRGFCFDVSRFGVPFTPIHRRHPSPHRKIKAKDFNCDFFCDPLARLWFVSRLNGTFCWCCQSICRRQIIGPHPLTSLTINILVSLINTSINCFSSLIRFRKSFANLWWRERGLGKLPPSRPVFLVKTYFTIFSFEKFFKKM